MKIGIYNQPSGVSIGGSEYCVAVLAEALGTLHQVDVLHHRCSLTVEQLAERFGTNLSAVRLRYVAPDQFPTTTHIPWRRYQAAQTWHATLSEPYDIFINFTHQIPPFCYAPRGVLAVLFPTYQRPYVYASQDNPSVDNAPRLKRLRRVYFDWEWKKRLDTYQLKTAISHFSKTWTKRRWDIDCQVIYPPADNHFRVAHKENLILSVGRFTGTGHTKRQLEMMTTFRQMEETRFLRRWQYFSVGGLDDMPAHCAYFEEVRRIGMECGAQALANIERDELKRIFEQAKIFWHAAGYGEDEMAHPELAEHFGIVTVEAMAAGCVPIVVNKGGQPEIVEHGVNGFLWNTLDELKEYTLLLARDEQLRERMSEAARARARFFSRDRFVNSFLEIL